MRFILFFYLFFVFINYGTIFLVIPQMVFLSDEVYRALYFHLTDRFLLFVRTGIIYPIDRVVLQIPYTSYERRARDGVISDKISVLSSARTSNTYVYDNNTNNYNNITHASYRRVKF